MLFSSPDFFVFDRCSPSPRWTITLIKSWIPAFAGMTIEYFERFERYY